MSKPQIPYCLLPGSKMFKPKVKSPIKASESLKNFMNEQTTHKFITQWQQKRQNSSTPLNLEMLDSSKHHAEISQIQCLSGDIDGLIGSEEIEVRSS